MSENTTTSTATASFKPASARRRQLIAYLATELGREIAVPASAKAACPVRSWRAVGTGAYAPLSTSIWQLSGQLGWPRLVAIMLCAVTAMVAWLIIGHGLWEKAEGSVARTQRSTTPRRRSRWPSRCSAATRRSSCCCSASGRC